MAQQNFCHEYALHQNASEAFRAAYPSARKWKSEAVSQEASKLLRNPRIAPRVEELMQRKRVIAERRFDISAERVLAELAAIAFANADDYFAWGTRQRQIYRGGKPVLDADGKPVTRPTPVAIIKPSSSLTRAQKAAVAGIEMGVARDGTPTINVKLADKRGALRDLAQHLGLFEHVEQHKHAHAHVHVEVPALEGMDSGAALKAFEAFRLKLAQAQPALPAPLPVAAAA
jgi:phage terminase small subunit